MGLRPIFYDTETTGIKAERDRIIEIAAFDPVKQATFEHFVNPGIPIPPDATAIHHITDEMVADAPSFAEVGAKFIDFCSGDTVLIAHNNDAFDIHFLKHEFGRHSLTFPSDWKFFDTLKWARRYRSDLPRHTLQFLREIYGFPQNNAHRALDDVIVLHQVFTAMTDDLSMDDVYQLMNQSRAPQPLHHMPFGKHQGLPLHQVPKNYVLWLKDTGAFDKPENKELKDSFEKLGVFTPA